MYKYHRNRRYCQIDYNMIAMQEDVTWFEGDSPRSRDTKWQKCPTVQRCKCTCFLPGFSARLCLFLLEAL